MKDSAHFSLCHELIAMSRSGRIVMSRSGRTCIVLSRTGIGMKECLQSNQDNVHFFQDSFTVFDPKQLRRKGKERHIFLFEQALLFSKETKDADGKIKYLYKNKLKVK